MYIYVCIYMYVYIYIYTYTCTHVYTCNRSFPEKKSLVANGDHCWRGRGGACLSLFDIVDIVPCVPNGLIIEFVGGHGSGDGGVIGRGWWVGGVTKGMNK